MKNQIDLTPVDLETYRRAVAHGRGPVRAVFNYARHDGGYLYQDGFYWESPQGKFWKVTQIDYLLDDEGQRVTV